MSMFDSWHTEKMDDDKVQEGADKWDAKDGGHWSQQESTGSRSWTSKDDFEWGYRQN